MEKVTDPEAMRYALEYLVAATEELFAAFSDGLPDRKRMSQLWAAAHEGVAKAKKVLS